MTQAQRNAISNPAHALMIYQTDNNPGFYYNSGTTGSPSWTILGARDIDDLSDGIAFGSSVFLGTNAGTSAVSGADNNVAVGKDALKDLTDGDNNIAIGAGAMSNVTSGSNNILIGNWTQSVTGIGATNELSIGQVIYGTGIYGSGAKIGIGYNKNAPASTLDVDGDVTIKTVLHLTPSSAPSSPSAGDIYFDSSTNKARCYDGTTWQDLW